MKICLLCEGMSETTQDHCASCGRPLLDTQAVHFPLRRGEEEAANPLLGVLIDGKYRIHNVLGKGGMGTVFRATHEVSLVPVALKILNPRFSARREYRDYFLAEAQKAGRVTHEHTARIMDVGEAEDGTVYIAMEIVSGTTLHDCIHGEIPLAPIQIVDILQQLCEAMAAAHQAGLVHRDLSTRNVMVVVRQGEPFVKILDFGIAKGLPMLGGAPSDRSAAAPMGFASPPYSAPEHLAGQNVDARADVYSLGVIGYEALVQRFPVAGKTGKELAKATMDGSILPLDPPAGTPVRLTRLIMRMLATDPAERPSSADEVLQELSRIRQPGAALLRTLSVVSFVVAVVVMTLAFAGRQERVFQSKTGSLQISPPGGTPRLRQVHSRTLQQLRFEYAGFDARRLQVEVQRPQDGFRELLQLEPEIIGRGVVDLAPTEAKLNRVRTRLRQMSREGALVLVFKLPGAPYLGRARLRIDDEPPDITLTSMRKDSSVLAGVAKEELRITANDLTSIHELSLHCVRRPGNVALGKPLKLDPKAQTQTVKPLEQLGYLQSGVEPIHDIGLQLVAVDVAGNLSRTKMLRFDRMDFRVPQLHPSSDTAEAIWDETGAEVRLLLTDFEPALKVVVYYPGDTGHGVTSRQTGNNGLLLTLPFPEAVADPKRPFQDGTYAVQLQDDAGNSSERFQVELTFRSKELQERFELPRPDPNQAARLVEVPELDRLVWDGRSVAFTFLCDKRYEVASVEPGDVATKGTTTEPGKTVILLKKLEKPAAKTEYQLKIVVQRVGAATDQQTVHRTLQVLATPPTLQLGEKRDPSSQRFLTDVLDHLFNDAGQGKLKQGDWRLDPTEPRLLRGHVLVGGSRRDLSKRQIVAAATNSRILPTLDLRMGPNLVALQIQDVLGRPIHVLFGTTAAPLEEGITIGGVRQENVRLIADFRYQDQVATPVSSNPAITLEAGQPAQLALRSGYRFTARDRIVLHFVQQQLLPKIRPLGDGGCELRFWLPYDRIRVATNKSEEELRKEGEELTVDAELETPAGRQEFKKLSVRTIRSSLAPRGLATVFDGAKGTALATIRMVPVLSPRKNYADPVPASVPRRGVFRPQPQIEVKDIADYYLQRSELTRAQYRTIVELGLKRLPEGAAARRALVFPTDPLATERLTAAGLLPVIHAGNRSAWRQRWSAGPDQPVTGVSFHQAYAVARLLGQLLGDDPELFRLPMGAELDLACLGPAPQTLKLNGGGRRDSVAAPRGGDFLGLDFGVREWVQDLPWVPGTAGGLIRTLQSDHTDHLRASTGFASNQYLGDAREELAARGVVRGVAAGEVTMLFDVRRPAAVLPTGAALPATVPGVVRTLYVRRDGAGILSQKLDPHLDRIGMRLASDAAFIAEVRRR